MLSSFNCLSNSHFRDKQKKSLHFHSQPTNFTQSTVFNDKFVLHKGTKQEKLIYFVLRWIKMKIMTDIWRICLVSFLKLSLQRFLLLSSCYHLCHYLKSDFQEKWTNWHSTTVSLSSNFFFTELYSFDD